ncbi:T6SS effector BTH_I2691 family protein [Stenotrophomonas nematodicola]|uniref:T6SS effector BTH_I2691 family protein n=1 Tax=Stenotrophomonas nematodicola TaxID=2656746 RepID=UPI003D9A0DBB
MDNRIVGAALKTVSPCVQGNCRNCDKTGLPVHPFRYSAFCSDDASILGMVPALRPSTGAALPELRTARYALRMMREGYLYVVLKRHGLTQLDSYYVRPSGRLMRFRGEPPDRKTSAIACARMAASANALMVAIDAPEEVAMSYWLFTPDPLSSNKEAELVEQAEMMAAQGVLQAFSPQQWVAQQGSQEFALSPMTIRAFVLEYLAIGEIAALAALQAPIVAALDEQAFPALCDPLDPPMPPRFDALRGGAVYQSALQRSLPALREAATALHASGGVGIALQDAIGITQELNAWRNGAMEGVEPWMRHRDAHGRDNAWKYLAAHQYAQIREGVLSKRIRLARDDAADRANAPYDKIEEDLKTAEVRGGMIDPGPMLEIVTITRDADPFGLRRRVVERAERLAKERFDRAEAQLDGTQTSILEEFKAIAAPCEQKMRERAPDHLAWLCSPMLTLALRSYDQHDLVRGWAFAVQVGIAMTGMEADDESRLVLDDWWKTLALVDPASQGIEEGNLAWRVYALNHLPLAQELVGALEEANTYSPATDVWGIAATGNEAVIRVLDMFDKANAALRACENAGQVAWFKRSLLGTVMSWYAQWGRVLYKTSLPAAADKVQMNLMIRALQLRMGDYARNYPVAEFHARSVDSVTTSYWRGQFSRYVRMGLDREMAKGREGGVYQGRALMLATLFESLNLMIKGRNLLGDAPTARQGAELIASGLTLSGGVLVILEEGSTWIKGNFKPGSQVAAYSEVWGGRLGLYGGFLVATAGVVGAVLDGAAVVQSAKSARVHLAIAYGARGVISGTAAVVGATISFAGSAPFLRALLERSRTKFFRTLFDISSRLAATLIAKEMVMLMLRAWGARLSWAAAAASVLIIVMSPDEFEKWSEKSIFRLDKSSKGYQDRADELVALVRIAKGGS